MKGGESHGSDITLELRGWGGSVGEVDKGTDSQSELGAEVDTSGAREMGGRIHIEKEG